MQQRISNGIGILLLSSLLMLLSRAAGEPLGLSGQPEPEQIAESQ